MTHTPEPWEIESALDGGFVVHSTHKNVEQAIIGGVEHDFSGTITEIWPTSIDDWRRAVACVNACRGIPTRVLEAEEFNLILGTLAQYGLSYVFKNQDTLDGIGMEQTGRNLATFIARHFPPESIPADYR